MNMTTTSFNNTSVNALIIALCDKCGTFNLLFIYFTNYFLLSTKMGQWRWSVRGGAECCKGESCGGQVEDPHSFPLTSCHTEVTEREISLPTACIFHN